jgi:hypothetical protein
MRRNFNDEIVYSRKAEYDKMNQIKDSENDENEE